MSVTKELHNLRDRNAVVVKMPGIGEIEEQYHNDVTRPAKGSEPEQRVKDVADKIIGPVPANLCKIFNNLLDDAQVQKVTCMPLDNPTISEVPPSHQSFKKNKAAFDRRGGGGIIPCKYKLYCYESNYKMVKQHLQKSLKALEFQGTEKVDIPVEDKYSAASCPW